ncbi:MAG: TraB/GumN family protein [Halomonadaceae bacterium]|nr:MAG: TraB/GumN family protein [Halomonadaceae bacterium]
MTDALLTSGPMAHIDVNGTRYTLLGTAHVSKASADEVRTLIASGEFDAVALELCESRYNSILKPDNMASMDLFQVIREGKAGMVAASLVMGAFQQRVAAQSGIEPGAEMRAALEEAEKANLPVELIDREIGTTLRRVYHNVPWYQRMNLIAGLFASLVTRETVSAESIEELKEGDVLEATFNEFAEKSERLYQPLIAERDRYMALRLFEERAKAPHKRVLVVIGAGHLKGLKKHLETAAPEHPKVERETLDTTPPKGKVLRAIPWVVAALVITGFIIGFTRNTDLGLQLVAEWFLINGTFSAIGATIALAHPLTILASFLAAPITSLNPTIGAGFVAAGVELMLRKPKVADFSSLRDDVAKLSGWWRNRVSRTLMIFMLASIGSAIGTYVAGFRIFEQLTSLT